MREEEMDQPTMEMEIEIQGAEDEDEMMFEDMAPEGNYTPKALNNLVKATNRLLPLFGQTPDYPTFSEPLTKLPTDFVRVLMMFSGAIDDAVGQDLIDNEMSFELSEITDDAMLNMLAGKINNLVNSKEFKRYLKETPSGDVEEEMDMSAGESMMGGEAPDEEQMDALFMERM
tara:strand:- start:147 stop:665 length:519 start_codon:yes stop_codon:yes gene_type:complete